MTDRKLISLGRTGPVAQVKLCRSEASNALDLEMIHALDTAWSKLQSDPEIRVVILSGEGRNFCAGADLGWLATAHEGRTDDWLTVYDALDAMLQRLARFDKPVICHLSGSVVGAGLALAAVSDIVLAEDNCRFALPELQLGMVPTVVVPHLLTRMSPADLRRVCLAETHFNSTRAQEMRLVDHIIPSGEVADLISRLIREVLSAAPDAARAFKRLLASMPAAPVSKQAEFVRAVAVEGLRSEEMARGIESVLAGRTPDWGPA